MSYTVPGLIFIAGLLASLLTDAHSPILVRESILATSTLTAIFWFFHRKNFPRLEDHIFFIASVFMLMAAFVNGGTFLGETPIPRLKLYLKAIFMLCLALLFVAFRMKASAGLLVLLTAVLASNVFLQWFYLGITLRSIPLAAYLITSWFYLPSRTAQPRFDRADWLLACLCVSGLLSTVFAWDRISAAFGLIHWILAMPFFLLGRYFLPTAEIRTFFRAAIMLFGVAILFFAFFSIYTARGEGLSLAQSIAGYQVNAVGGYIALFFGILLWSVITEEKTILRIALLAALILALVVLYVTSSRASMLAVMATIAAYIAFFPRPGREKLFRASLLWPGLILAAVFLWWFRDSAPAQEMFNSATMSIRLAVWKLYIANTWTYSPLLGFGPESYLISASIPPALQDPQLLNFLNSFIHQFGPLLHAHNLLVQVILCFGILGLLPCAGLLLLFLGQVRRTLRAESADSWQLAAQISLTALFVQELFDYTLADAMTFYPAMTMLGLAFRKEPVELPPPLNQQRHTAIPAVFAGVLLTIMILLGWNRIVYVRQIGLLGGGFTADAFANITFLPGAHLTAERIQQFERNDRFLLSANIDHRIHQLSGEFYLELYRRGIRRESLIVAEQRYRRCLELMPTSSFCASRIASILNHQGRKAEAEEMNRISILHDPFSLNPARLEF